MLSEWDYDKNGDLLPSLVSKQSGNPVWWKCSHCGYEEHKAANIKIRNKTCKNCGLEYWKLEQQFKGNDTPKEKLLKPKKKSKTVPIQLGQFNL